MDTIEAAGKAAALEVIRPCVTFDEIDACVELQKEAWGFEDGDVVPRRSFVVAQKIGGQVLGAFYGAEMAGFAMAMPGIRTAEQTTRPMIYLHSHMLAVRGRYQNRGIGRRLKLAQREDALARGIDLMEWTFDPLEIKNAFFNIARLGAIVRRYSTDLYGVSSSRLQGGLQTDRLHAEWWMKSARVEAAIAGQEIFGPEIEESILVPAQVKAWKVSPDSLPLAEAVQTQCRRRFEDAFGRRLAIVGFRIDNTGNGTYDAAPWRPGQGDGE